MAQRTDGVTSENGVGYRAMGLDGFPAQGSVGQTGKGGDGGVDNRHQHFHYTVLAAAGNAGVEGDIFLDVAGTIFYADFYLIAEVAKLFNILRSGV